MVAFAESDDELARLATLIKDAPAFADVMLEGEKLAVRIDELARVLLKQGLAGVEYGKLLKTAKVEFKTTMEHLRADVDKRAAEIRAERTAAPKPKVEIKALEGSAQEIIDERKDGPLRRPAASSSPASE